jgi:nucleoside-diphosphate-sugar epimerase
MRVAISGARGLIGRRVLEHYAQRGVPVHALSRQLAPQTTGTVRWFCHDLASCSEADLHEFMTDCDIVFHCAAELRDPMRMDAVNFHGTKKLFTAALHAGVKRWVQLSSVGVYGPVRFGTVTEKCMSNPHNDYERSKAAADEWLQLRRADDIDVVLLRPSNVFAPDMTNQSLFALIKAIRLGRFFFVGTRQSTMNYVHADDVVHALTLCGERSEAKGKTFIVSEYLQLAKFVDIVSDIIGIESSRRIFPEWPIRLVANMLRWLPRFPLKPSRIDALTNRVVYSQESITRVLGYHPAKGIEKGLIELVDSLSARKIRHEGQ